MTKKWLSLISGILFIVLLCHSFTDAQAANTWTFTRRANEMLNSSAPTQGESYTKAIDRAAALKDEINTSRLQQSAVPSGETGGSRSNRLMGSSASAGTTSAQSSMKPVATFVPTPKPSPTAMPTPMPTSNINLPTATPVPVATATPVPVATATPAPTVAPTPVPTVAPTPEPTVVPTPVPTVAPTPEPVPQSPPTLSADDYKYLVSNADVNWSDGSAAVQWARANTAGMTDQQIFNVIFGFVAQNCSYDLEVYYAQSLPAGYKPNIDTTFSTKKGVCYDLSALLAGMLRSCGVPTKLMKGSCSNVTGYHAWNEVLIGGSWKVVDMTMVCYARQEGKSYKTYQNAGDYSATSSN